MRLVVAVVFFLSGCFLGTHCNMMSTQSRDFIIHKYNQYRNMQDESNNFSLVWSDTLAQAADNWSSNCRFEHQSSPNKNYGENMAFYTGNDVTENMEQAFQDWYQYYSYFRENGAISSSSNQKDWYQAREVGCAYSRCPNLFTNGRYVQNAWYFVCRYNPGGYVKGQYGYSQGSGVYKTEIEMFNPQEGGWNQDTTGFNQDIFGQGMGGYGSTFGNIGHAVESYRQIMDLFNGQFGEGSQGMNADYGNENNNQDTEGSGNNEQIDVYQDGTVDDNQEGDQNGEDTGDSGADADDSSSDTDGQNYENDSSSDTDGQSYENELSSMSVEGGCVDTTELCAKWADEGQCQTNPRYMTMYCRHSCKLCQYGQTGGCVDQYASCPRFVFSCQTSEMTRTHCPATCGLC